MTMYSVPSCDPTSYSRQMFGCVTAKMARASRSKGRLRSASPATSWGRILMATFQSSRVSRARYTSPFLPPQREPYQRADARVGKCSAGTRFSSKGRCRVQHRGPPCASPYPQPDAQPEFRRDNAEQQKTEHYMSRPAPGSPRAPAKRDRGDALCTFPRRRPAHPRHRFAIRRRHALSRSEHGVRRQPARFRWDSDRSCA